MHLKTATLGPTDRVVQPTSYAHEGASTAQIMVSETVLSCARSARSVSQEADTPCAKDWESEMKK